MRLYYHVFKNYKGLLRKKHKGNTQMLTVPEIPSPSYFTHGVIVGKLVSVDEEYDGSLALMTVAMDDISKIEQFVEALGPELGKNYELVESVPCNVIHGEENLYKVKILKKGEFIKSDLSILYSESVTKEVGRKMFMIKGKIELYTDKIRPIQAKMMGMKKMAYLRQPRVGMPRA